MKNRFKPLLGAIVLTMFLCVIFYATQAFSTVYYRKGILIGSLASAFVPTKSVFYTFGSLFFLVSLAVLVYIFIKRRNYGIHTKNANDVIKVFATFSLGIFIVMIISFTKTTPSALAILSWIVFAFGIAEVITLGIFAHKIYRT